MSTNQNPTNKQRREEARNKARAARLAEKRRERTKKIVTWSVTGIAVLAVGALATMIVTTNNSLRVEAATTSPNNMATDGIILTSPTTAVENTGYDLEEGTPEDSAPYLEDSTVPHVEIYYDYSCPHCKVFEDENASYLDEFLEQGEITIEHKPMLTIGNEFSFSGANAAACVANYAPEHFQEAHNALFAANPEGTAPRSAAAQVLDGLNVTDDVAQELKSCQASDVFYEWQTAATEHAQARTDEAGEPVITGTPSIFVDGVKYPFNPSMFHTFLGQVIAGADPAELIAEQS